MFLFAACVPQTKQTECGSNEAFNASLRTCVPIIGGPSSFINVDSYSPQFTQTRAKSDSALLTFTISISNPYNQSYTVEWVRVYNAAAVSLCGNGLTCTTNAYYLGTTLGQVGTHIITARIKNANGAVVDSQNFELKVNELPKPVVSMTTITPPGYAYDYYPTDANIPFSFTISNSGASISALDAYKTVWTVTKNGSTIASQTETDTFSNYGLNDTNFAYFGDPTTSPASPKFDPDGAVYGVGLYIVRAVVSNTYGEIIHEQQWNINIKQPNLTNVSSISLPAPGITVKSHYGVAYNDYPASSWVYTGTQPQFCILVDDRDGTYPADGKSLLVKFYLDGTGGEVCTKQTLDTAGTQTVCLFDANPCVGSGTASNADNTLKSAMRFTNSSSSVSQLHTVVARVFDEATTYEILPANVLNPSGLYPIKWNVQVDPINSAPTISFGPPASNPTGCSFSTFEATGCQVTQGTTFRVSFSVTDDFYSPTVAPQNFAWTARLKTNNADVTTPPKVTGCTRALGNVTADYTTFWYCDLEVPHYRSTGPLSPVGPFEVVVTMEDSGSPVGGTPKGSQNLTWKLNVTETNSISPNITIQTQGISATGSHISRDNTPPAAPTYFDGSNFATEMETVNFRIAVVDPELDDFYYSIYSCGTGSTSSVCNFPQMITSQILTYTRASQPPVTLPFTDTVNTDPLLVSALQFPLPETLLLDAGQDVDKSTAYPVYFKVEVSDKPSTLTGASVATHSRIFTLNVKNYNPAPVISTTGANPAPNTLGTAYPVMGGYPFSINPGTVTDASLDSDEGTIVYQWYATSSVGPVNWKQIVGANKKDLTWTPDYNGPSTLELKLCVGDRAAANPILAPNAGGNCSTSSWFIAPKSYLALPTPPSAGINVSSEVAVWNDTSDGDATQDVIYSAYVGNNNTIYVNKTVRDTTSALNATSFSTVSFAAIEGSAASIVTNISIAGSANSLYIAYGASTSSAPSILIPRIRRINKAFNAATVGEKTGLAHRGKFGFSYTDYTIDVSACSNCTKTNATDSAEPYIDITAPGINGNISINGYTFTASATATLANEICSSATCSANDGASSLAAKINSSTNPLLQGLTAFASGNRVTIHGMNSFDSYNSTITIGNYGIGKIFVIGSYWFLPVINASLAGADQNKISILSGATDIKLKNAGLSVSTEVLNAPGQTAVFESQISTTDHLVIGSISSAINNAGRAYVSRFAYDVGSRTFSAGATTLPIFGTRLFKQINVAANAAGNNYVYVIAKERDVSVADDGAYNIGRYAGDLSTVSREDYLMNQLTVTDDTSGVISDTLLKNPRLVALPNSSDARLFFTSLGTSAFNPGQLNSVRMARWKSSNTFSCGICAPIGIENMNSAVAVSNVGIDTTIGTTGYTAAENVKDVSFVLMNYRNGSDYHPQLGIINLESETIQPTTVDSSTHLWRTPFAK